MRASAEAVLAKHPDLVVMYKGTNPRLRAHHRRGRREDSGRAMGQFARRCAQDHLDARASARRAGSRARTMLKAMDAKLAAARAAAPEPPVSALIYEPNGYATADAVSDAIMAAAGLTQCGGHAACRRGSGRIPVEAVVAAAPQLLILNASREGGPALADAALRHPALAALKGRSLIVRASLTPLLCPGPWSADAAGEFARNGPQGGAACEGAGSGLRLVSRRCPAMVAGKRERGAGPIFSRAKSAAAPATVGGEFGLQMPLGNREGGASAIEPQARKPAVAASSIR